MTAHIQRPASAPGCRKPAAGPDHVAGQRIFRFIAFQPAEQSRERLGVALRHVACGRRLLNSSQICRRKVIRPRIQHCRRAGRRHTGRRGHFFRCGPLLRPHRRQYGRKQQQYRQHSRRFADMSFFYGLAQGYLPFNRSQEQAAFATVRSKQPKIAEYTLAPPEFHYNAFKAKRPPLSKNSPVRGIFSLLARI